MKRYIIVNLDSRVATWTEDAKLAEMYKWHEDHLVLDTDDWTRTFVGETAPIHRGAREDLNEGKAPCQWWKEGQWYTWEEYKELVLS